MYDDEDEDMKIYVMLVGNGVTSRNNTLKDISQPGKQYTFSIVTRKIVNVCIILYACVCVCVCVCGCGCISVPVSLSLYV